MQSGIPAIKFVSKNNDLINSYKRFYRYYLKKRIKFPHKISFQHLASIDDYSVDNNFNINSLIIELNELDNESLSKLILVIDLFSLEDDELSLVKELIISFPEIKFLFPTTSSEDLLNIFFNELKDDIFFHLHSFNLFSEDKNDLVNEFNIALKGKNNLFDASFLRTALRTKKLEKIGFSNNFNNLCNKRKALAYAVDEEKTQNYLISYALFKYGYRVLPISSYCEIDKVHKNQKTNNKPKNLSLIIRDWDIQFEDYPQSSDPKTDFVNHMRGIFKKEIWESDKDVWGVFDEIPIFIFSRLSNNNSNEDEPNLVEPNKNTDKLWHKELLDSLSKNENNVKKKPDLFGISKPLDGLSEIEKILILFNDKNFINQPFDIDTICRKRDKSKDKGSHSVPPDIYHIGEKLLFRAQKYYDDKKFLYSAILAQEAMEILNGLHNDLHLDAIYLKHLSEVSLETEYLGLENFKKCAQKRFKEIKSEVLRIGSNTKAINNFLSQIFNDIRHIYKEKEQFDAAEEALKEFISVNHSLNVFSTLRQFRNLMVEKFNTIRENSENVKRKTFSFVKDKIKGSWFRDFGWILLPYFILVLLIFQLNKNNIHYFPIWFAVLNFILLLIFIVSPKLHLISLVYTLVGRVPSLRFLVISIIMSQLFMSVIYSNYITCTNVLKYLYKPQCSISLNVLYTLFTMQASPDFEKIINPKTDKPSNSSESISSGSIMINEVEKSERKGFLILLIFHLVLVYFYLGTFISTLYQKLRKE